MVWPLGTATPPRRTRLPTQGPRLHCTAALTPANIALARSTKARLSASAACRQVIRRRIHAGGRYTTLAGSAGHVERGGDVDLLPDRVDQDVVSDHQRGERVRLVLTGLPGHRRTLQLG
jgi:hypothetical protein